MKDNPKWKCLTQQNQNQYMNNPRRPGRDNDDGDDDSNPGRPGRDNDDGDGDSNPGRPGRDNDDGDDDSIHRLDSIYWIL